MPVEWVGAAQAFTTTGFAAVTAWLLYERKTTTDKFTDAVNAMRQSNLTTAHMQERSVQHLADTLDDVKETLRDVRDELREVRREGGGQ